MGAVLYAFVVYLQKLELPAWSQVFSQAPAMFSWQGLLLINQHAFREKKKTLRIVSCMCQLGGGRGGSNIGF